MSALGKTPDSRRRGIGPFAGLFCAAWLSILCSGAFAGQNNDIKLLYFFSSSCKHCMEVRPAVIALSKKYGIEGWYFGGGQAQTVPFPVKAGDKKVAEEVYGVVGVPTIAVVVKGKYKQKLAGASDIGDAEVIIASLVRGALTVTEAAEQAGHEITVTGWITARGEYFKNAQFYVTDRKTELRLQPWLPLEAVKSPFRNNKRPRLMSDVVRKPVVLRGSVKKTDTGAIFIVKKELSIE